MAGVKALLNRLFNRASHPNQRGSHKSVTSDTLIARDGIKISLRVSRFRDVRVELSAASWYGTERPVRVTINAKRMDVELSLQGIFDEETDDIKQSFTSSALFQYMDVDRVLETGHILSKTSESPDDGIVIRELCDELNTFAMVRFCHCLNVTYALGSGFCDACIARGVEVDGGGGGKKGGGEHHMGESSSGGNLDKNDCCICYHAIVSDLHRAKMTCCPNAFHKLCIKKFMNTAKTNPNKRKRCPACTNPMEEPKLGFGEEWAQG